MRPCPQLGGGHPLVVVAEAGAHGGGRRGFASKTRYAAVAVVAKLPQPPLHVRGAPVLIACVWAASFETFTSRTDGVASFDMTTTSYESHRWRMCST